MQLLEELPKEILSWQLKGAGLDNFGARGRPDTVPFPNYTEDNLIARIDAVGLCYSDIKLISAGSTHPRIEGRNLSAQPTVPGHEVAMTIVGVGNIAIVGIPGELFVELGLAIRANPFFAQTFVAGYCNDLIGYIPTRAAYAEGGYEVDTARIAAGCGETIVDLTLSTLAAMRP